MIDALKVDCPRCGVEPGNRCRTLASGRTTDTHAARMDAYWNTPREQLTPEARLMRAIFGDDA